MRLMSVFVPLLLASWLAHASPEDGLDAKIVAVMSKYVEDGGPGAVVGVVRDGRLVFLGAYGLSDIEASEEMTTGRVFDLASCSKNLTAYGVMLLAERGMLSLEDDVRRHLPELPERRGGRTIRVIDLLHMVSGHASYQDLLEEYEGVTNEDIVPLVAASPLEFPTGSRYEYSNTDYNLLATICARASGMSFGAFMKKEVFDPLGMGRSVVLEKTGQRVPGRVTGYKKEDGRWVPDRDDTPGIVGDGSIFSSVEDLAKYDAALREGTLVSRALLKQAWTSGETDDGEPTDYGFGWVVGEDGDGGLLIDHGGSWNGTSTYIGRWVDKDYSIILLSNAYDAEWEEAIGRISEALEGE